MKRALLLAGLAVLVQLPVWRTGLYVADEGWTVHIASRVAQGEVLYRDVHTYLTPGIYLTLAPLMALRPTLLWGRLGMLAAYALLAWAAARLARPRGRDGAARGELTDLAAVAGIALLGAGGYPSYTIPSYTGMSLACGAAALALWSDGRAPVTAGALLGAALLYKQTSGLAALLGLAAAQLLEPRLRIRPLLLGMLAIGGAAVALLAAQGALLPMMYALSPAGLARYSDVGRVPLPSYSDLGTPRLLTTLPFLVDLFPGVLASPPLWLCARLVTFGLYYLPLPAALAAGVVRRREGRAAWALPAAASLSFLTLFPRADVTHLLQVLPLAAVCAAILAARLLPPRALGALAIAALAAALSLNVARRSWSATPLMLPGDGGLRVSAEQASVRDIILRLRSDMTEPMLAAPWGALHYFLASRPNPTRHALLLPGNVSPEERREVMATLEARPPRHIVWSTVDLRNLNPLSFEEFFPELVAFRDARYRRVMGPLAGEELWELRP